MENSAERIYHSRNVVNLCIDAYDAEKQCGKLWNQYEDEPVCFSSLFEALEKMEDLYDTLQYPYASTEIRSFLSDGRKVNTIDGDSSGIGQDMPRQYLPRQYLPVESFDNVISHRGLNATFIIRVQYRQHSSWQGEVIWVDAWKRKYFGSVLELMRLIGGTLEKCVENSLVNAD